MQELNEGKYDSYRVKLGHTELKNKRKYCIDKVKLRLHRNIIAHLTIKLLQI